jgi:hypothetical protein
MNIENLKPTTMDGIKSLAKKIKKRDGIQHAKALDAAAFQAGYQNFRHAQNQLRNRMKIELNLPGFEVVIPKAAEGSVVDHLATKVAAWTESALTKTCPEDLTHEEIIGLALSAGCDMRTVIIGEASYRIEAARPIEIALVDGVWQVYQEPKEIAI